MSIREARRQDFEQIWPFFREIAAAGETYAYPRDISKEQALKLWMDTPKHTYAFEERGKILGSYYIATNHAGPDEHVCNCGYMVAPAARGHGVATAMCEHSQEVARKLGYQAMQFNFVVSSNDGAVRLWNKLGFTTVGRLPKAFNHPVMGYVDALVMYKWLATQLPNQADNAPAPPTSGVTSHADLRTSGEPMFDHVVFGVSDYAASKAFFLKALEPIGIAVVSEGPLGIELSADGKASLCLFQTAEKPAHLHLAFTAGSRRQVEAFHRAAMEAGAKDNGVPGLRPNYSGKYYAAFVIGPDGHNIEVVCHESET